MDCHTWRYSSATFLKWILDLNSSKIFKELQRISFTRYLDNKLYRVAAMGRVILLMISLETVPALSAAHSVSYKDECKFLHCV